MDAVPPPQPVTGGRRRSASSSRRASERLELCSMIAREAIAMSWARRHSRVPGFMPAMAAWALAIAAIGLPCRLWRSAVAKAAPAALPSRS